MLALTDTGWVVKATSTSPALVVAATEIALRSRAVTSPLSVVSLRWPARRSAEMSPLSPWTTTSASNGIARSMSALQRLTGPGVRARAAHGQRRAVHARVHDRLAPQPLQLLAHHDALGLGALQMDLPRPGAHDDALDVAVDRRRGRAVVLEGLADADRDAAHDEQDAEDEQHESWRRESHRVIVI